MLSPGVYNENVLLWKPLKLQGLGPGGIIGAHELQARDPEDPRFNIPGTVIDGRYFQQNATDYDADDRGARAVRRRRRAAPPGAARRRPHRAGQDHAPRTTSAPALTAVVQRRPASTALGLTTGQGDGAGGIQLQASANNIQLTNNVLENNGGVVAGGIGLGQPYDHAQPQLQRAASPTTG